MTSPQRSLDAIATRIADLTAQWAAYETIEANLATPTLAATNLEPGHGADINRPTETTALAHLEPNHPGYYETVDKINAALGLIIRAQQRVTFVNKYHAGLAAQLANDAQRARCDGSHDPLCTNFAARRGICWAGIKAMQRANILPNNWYEPTG